MISVLFSWFVAFCTSLCFGYVVVNVGYQSRGKILQSMDIYLVCGLMLINVYAEYFSIFYKVGMKAWLLLAVLGFVLLTGYFFRHRQQCLDDLKRVKLVSAYQWIIGTFIILAIVSYTIGYPKHYDTSLYHAQAIYWIEQYGVVPGLGNLHNRFAYNSAFMVLQALFSFRWLFEQSLHSMNGYICSFFVCYALLTNNIFKRKSFHLADMLKIATIMYVCVSEVYISSPSSDTLTMLLLLYICTKWSEFIEKNITDAIPYTFLCILGVYAISVKLSAATCIVLAIYPVTLFVQRKQWKPIMANLLAGFIVVLPWLIRNVIISGYLIYPYPQIDLFNFDWKMPASVLTFDSREIIVWGRHSFDVARYGEPIWCWFSDWVQEALSIKLVVGMMSVIGLIIYLIREMIKRNPICFERLILIIYSIVGLVGWLFSSPLMRYGMVYLFIPTCILAEILLDRYVYNHKFVRGGVELTATIILIAYGSTLVGDWKDLSSKPIFMQEDYEWKLTKETELQEGVSIWFPVEGDQSSGDVFPCVPYVSMVEKIELRGNTLANGFRMREEYKGLKLNEYGYEW